MMAACLINTRMLTAEITARVKKQCQTGLNEKDKIILNTVEYNVDDLSSGKIYAGI